MKRSLPFLLLIVVWIGCAGPTPRPEPCGIEGMRNGTRYGDLLFGGQPSQGALEEIARQGYKTVLSTRGVTELDWDERAKVEALGMTFASIPMPHPIETIPDAWVERLDVLMQNGERPMVLHCSSGNRVAGLWAVWQIERNHRDPEEILAVADRIGMGGIRVLVEKRLEENRSGAARQP